MICVDPMVESFVRKHRLACFRWPRCHMFADDDDMESLHHLARLMGLRREWFQSDRYPPHYDLFGKGKRDAALAYGAKEVSQRYPVELRRSRKA